MKDHEFRQILGSYHIDITPDMEKQFTLYTSLLLEWNEKLNLTAITDIHEIDIKHYLDSLLLLRAYSIPEGTTLLDVGTGAGFPGVPLKIVRPDLELTLLDSLQKRLTFLEALTNALELDNVTLIHGRAEQLGTQAIHREVYEVVTARAVAHLPTLCEYCLPLTKVGGVFIALKSLQVEEEVLSAEKAVGELGGEIEAVKQFTLPGGHSRSIVIIRKHAQTPTKYPRKSIRIAKKPLV